MFMMCSQCVNGFIYSILYTCVTMYYVLQHSQGPTVSCQRRVIWNAGSSWRCCPRCSMLMVSLHMLWLRGWAVSIYSCSRAAERVLQRRLTLLFHFLAERENFSMTSTEQNNVTSETSVWDKCHKCNINCHIAVHARVLPPPPSLPPFHPGYQLTLNPPSAKMDCWQGLIGTWSLHITLPTTPNHVLLNYGNGANPMHFSLCNMYSCLWCSSAICRENPVIAIQY